MLRHPTGRILTLLLAVLALLVGGCRDKTSVTRPADSSSSATGEVQRTISLASGGTLRLSSFASATIAGRSGSGASTIRLARVGDAPPPSIPAWAYQVSDAIRIEVAGDLPTAGIDLSLRLREQAGAPAGLGQRLFLARLDHEELQREPARLRESDTTVTATVRGTGTYAVLAINVDELARAGRARWEGAAEPRTQGTVPEGCQAVAGSGVEVCLTAISADAPRVVALTAENRRATAVELRIVRADAMAVKPSAETALCGAAALAPAGGRATWELSASLSDLRPGNVVVSAEPSACAHVAQVVADLVASASTLDRRSIAAIAARWYAEPAHQPALAPALAAWGRHDRLGWAAELTAFLLQPANLSGLADALRQAGDADGGRVVSEGSLTPDAIIDAVASIRDVPPSSASESTDRTAGSVELSDVFGRGFPGPKAAAAATRLAWQGGRWYLHGANVPWVNWGCDFGCGRGESPERRGVSHPAQTSQLASTFSQAREDGVRVLRWWVFPGDPWQIQRDVAGVPTGIDPAVFVDFDAALRLAEANDLYYVFTLFSAPSSIPSGWLTDSGQRDALARALEPLFARYRGNPRVLAWDVVNEPEWDINNGRADLTSVQATVQAIAGAVHAQSTAYVTVASAMLTGVGAWVGLGLDFYTANWYDAMPVTACAICTNYENVIARYRLDKPLVIGEFFAGPEIDAAGRVADLYARGYAGAWAWSLFPDRTSDRMRIDLVGTRQFGTTTPDNGPRGAAPRR